MGAVAAEMDDYADVADQVVLGEEDLADRAEILRNQYRRMTPGNRPLVQDVGAWPAAWEEFSSVWDGAAAERDLGMWTVPVEAERDGADTVLRDGNGVELWRGQTDFSKDGTEGVVLTGALVAEADWPLYRAARGEIARRLAASRQDDGGGMCGTNGPCSNGLHFVSAVGNFTTNPPELHVGLAWTNNGMVDVFAYGPLHISETNVVTYTNDENAVVTATNVAWHAVEPTLTGYDNAWEWIGSMAVSNTGTNVFVDNGFPANRGIVRYYAAAEAVDSDGDGLNDGMEKFVWHTNPLVADTDGDGLSDGVEIATGTDPNESDTDGDGLPDGWEVQNGLDPLEATGADGAEGDPDGDGFDNALEYELGAPANNPAWNGAELAYKLTHATPVVTTNSRSVTTNWVGLLVEVNDSWDCVDGGDTNIQNKITTLEIPNLLDCGYHVAIGIAGVVEDVDAGYDKVYLYTDTETFYFSSHNGITSGEEKCIMTSRFAVKTNLVLANSTVRLRYDTVGNMWHSGAYAQIVSAHVVAPYAVEVSGPDFLCVGDTAQMTASGAGGGPYVWSVVGGAASIDANGVLTALSPGTARVTASNVGGCAGTKEVCVGRLVGLGASCPQFGPSGSFGTNPEVFEGGETNFWHPDRPPPYWWFPGSYTNPASRVLKVFYKYIKNSEGNPGPCSIVLNAVMEPEDIPSNAVTYAWTLVDGPANSGAFDVTDRKLVRFQNPTKGGLYKFQVEIGLPSGSNLLSGAWVLLPKAGGEIGGWLTNEVPIAVQRAQAWSNAVAAVALHFGENKDAFLFQSWIKIASEYFDYQGVAGMPTPRYSFTDADRPLGHQPDTSIPGMGGKKGNGDWDEPSYATLKGIVVHRVKINNLLYAVWGRTLGYDEDALSLGAGGNSILRGLGEDNESSQNAIELGFALYDAYCQHEDLDSILTPEVAMGLQTPDNSSGLNDVNLWPDPVPVFGNASFYFPPMPADYEHLTAPANPR